LTRDFRVRTIPLEQGLNRIRKGSAGSAQLADSFPNNTGEGLFALREEDDSDLTAIFFVAQTFYVAVGFKPIDQLDCAVVFDGQAFGKDADGGRLVFLEAANREEHLILLGFETFGERGGVAFAKKEANPIAQLGEGAVLGGCNLV